MRNVYFAGSILGGTFEGKREVYDYIVKCLNDNNLNIISQHGAVNPNAEMEKLSNKAIYKIDVDWLNQSDLLVAEVTAPSIGVGYEIGFAIHQLGIPVLCLHKEGVKPSVMVDGNPNCIVLSYSDIKDINGIVSEFLEYVPVCRTI